MCHAKTQISLGIDPVRSKTSLCTFRIGKGLSYFYLSMPTAKIKLGQLGQQGKWGGGGLEREGKQLEYCYLLLSVTQ